MWSPAFPATTWWRTLSTSALRLITLRSVRSTSRIKTEVSMKEDRVDWPTFPTISSTSYRLIVDENSTKRRRTSCGTWPNGVPRPPMAPAHHHGSLTTATHPTHHKKRKKEKRERKKPLMAHDERVRVFCPLASPSMMAYDTKTMFEHGPKGAVGPTPLWASKHGMEMYDIDLPWTCGVGGGVLFSRIIYGQCLISRYVFSTHRDKCSSSYPPFFVCPPWLTPGLHIFSHSP